MHFGNVTFELGKKFEAEIASWTRMPPKIFVNVSHVGADARLVDELLAANFASMFGPLLLAIVLPFDVNIHSTFRCEFVPTDFTSETLQVFMNRFDVLLQLAFLTKPFLADFANEVFDLVVDRPNVNLQLAFLSEILAAQLALELSDVLVHIFHVPIQIPAMPKLDAAYFTFVKFDVPVNGDDVHAKVFLPAYFEAAQVTLKVPGVFVN